MSETLTIRNEDVKELFIEVPEGHQHLRTTLVLQNGTRIVLQEATVANLVRAFVTIKTHPVITRLHLKGQRIEQRKEGFAQWQLLETDR